MKRFHFLLAVVMIGAFLLTACGGAAPGGGNDLLSTVKARGTLIVSSDPAYPPQSALKASPARTEGTKCSSDQQTLGELEGFDIDVSAAIAEGVGRGGLFRYPGLGPHHSRQLGRSLGHQRRLDDRHP